MAASGNNATNALVDIIHQHQLNVTARTSSSQLKNGQLFGHINIELRNHAEGNVPSSSPTASAIDPKVTDPQHAETDVMAGWRAGCGSDMGMGFFSEPSRIVN